jgi:hypothetical protein
MNDLAFTNVALHSGVDIDSNVSNETHVTNSKPLTLTVK